jgi:hypothetical protein
MARSSLPASSGNATAAGAASQVASITTLTLEDGRSLCVLGLQMLGVDRFNLVVDLIATIEHATRAGEQQTPRHERPALTRAA